MSEKYKPESEPDAERRWLAAEEKFRTKGSLAVTAEDHLAMGSTPPPELAANPGKAYVDLWSDEQIKRWLDEQRLGIHKLAEHGEPSRSFIENTEEDLRATERLLRERDRVIS